MRILGIDPGVSGAFCLVEDNKLVELHDMPSVKVMRNKSSRKTLDDYEAARIVDCMVKSGIDKVYIEKVGAMPGNSSMFQFGDVCGFVRGLVKAHFLPVEMVPPQTWKRKMRVMKSETANGEPTKEGAIIRIKELWPKELQHFLRKKDDGRAESALIAIYGCEIEMMRQGSSITGMFE